MIYQVLNYAQFFKSLNFKIAFYITKLSLKNFLPLTLRY